MAVARARAVARAVAWAKAMQMAGSGPSLRHLTKAIEPLALSTKAGGSYCEQASACPLPKQPTWWVLNLVLVHGEFTKLTALLVTYLFALPA